jgi:nucleotide-binding universal stress UspA family protein
MKNPMVLLPVELSMHAQVGLPVARTLAALEGAVLHVLHIAERGTTSTELMQSLELPRELLHDSVLEQRAGDPAGQILRMAVEHPTAAIVMCTHSGAAAQGTNLGPVAERVLIDAPCPVVLVRPERGTRPWEIRRVLFPHDSTPTTSAGMNPALHIARRAHARLWIVHVADPGALPPPEPGSLPAPRYMDQRQHEWPAWAIEFLERLIGVCGSSLDPSQLHLALARGEPAREVVHYAVEHQADLIVATCRGALDDAHGRVVKALLREAPCPVMIVKVHP